MLVDSIPSWRTPSCPRCILYGAQLPGEVLLVATPRIHVSTTPRWNGWNLLETPRVLVPGALLLLPPRREAVNFARWLGWDVGVGERRGSGGGAGGWTTKSGPRLNRRARGPLTLPRRALKG